MQNLKDKARIFSIATILIGLRQSGLDDFETLRMVLSALGCIGVKDVELKKAFGIIRGMDDKDEGIIKDFGSIMTVVFKTYQVYVVSPPNEDRLGFLKGKWKGLVS